MQEDEADLEIGGGGAVASFGGVGVCGGVESLLPPQADRANTMERLRSSARNFFIQ